MRFKRNRRDDRLPKASCHQVGDRPLGAPATITATFLFGILLFVQAAMNPGIALAQADPPVFFIEKIQVETQRLSPQIVLSESLLREGREYTEAELREAIHRINRLPFVLLAEFSLKKGSERGRYQLVVEVFETRRWFFQVGGNWLLEDPIDRIDPRLVGTFDDRIGETVDDVRSLVGRRFAIGKRGLLFASFGTEDGAYALGYQHYNLWDRNVLLSLSVGKEDVIGNVTVDDSSWSARAQLGIPIRGNHALRLLVAHSDLELGYLFGSKIESTETEAEIAWVYNSLDDPVLPREGELLEAGLIWSDVDDIRVSRDIDGRFFVQESSRKGSGVILAASRHWPVGARHSLSIGGRGFLEDLGGSERIWEAEASLGHQVFLVRRQELEKWRELRFETQTSWLRQDFSPSSSVPGLLQWVDSWSVRSGLVYRNGWGLFRLTAEYVDRELQ